ncbi:MAG: hypothetical protein ACRDPA_13170, partial [Solirubrobacteraceae bacterium]
GIPSADAPHLSPLSMTDCWCLYQAGYEPVGLADATTVYYARPSSITSQALGKRGRSAPPNQELPDLSAATITARDVCQTLEWNTKPNDRAARESSACHSH